MSFSYLTLAATALGGLLGPTLGAMLGHGLFGGTGGFWSALVSTLLASAAVVSLSMQATALVFPALLLLPLAAATGLEVAAR
jgi:hypothetical protein